MSDIAQIAQRLIKWDTDFPVNCWNGYAGLKELDRIIADAKVALTNAGLPFVDDLGVMVPEQKVTRDDRPPIDVIEFPAVVSLEQLERLRLSRLIRTRLIGVLSDDQDLGLEDSDWSRICCALEGDA